MCLDVPTWRGPTEADSGSAFGMGHRGSPLRRSSVCGSGGSIFSKITNRRHHCRHCGALTCAACMTKRLSVGDKKVRLRRPVASDQPDATPVYGSVTPWHRWVGSTPAHPHEEVRTRACAALTDGCGVGHSGHRRATRMRLVVAECAPDPSAHRIWHNAEEYSPHTYAGEDLRLLLQSRRIRRRTA